MRPNAKQKRALAAAVEAPLRMLQWGYRKTRRRSNPIDLSDAAQLAAVERVLVVRLDAIGDLLLSEPALGVLRRRFPNARIDLVASPVSAEVLQGNPNVDHLITYRAPWHVAWRGASVAWPAETARFWGVTAALAAQNYDVGFELRGDLRDILFMAAAAPRTAVGNSFRGGGKLLHYDAPVNAASHQVAMAVAIASAGGPLLDADPPRVYPSAEDHGTVAAHLPGEGVHLIGLHLGAGFPSKQLPFGHFVQVVQALHATHPAAEFLVVGAAAERRLAQALKEVTLLPVHDMTGKLTLLQTAAALSRCRLFVGNDSAPMHLAAAVGTPVVTFFGPSEPWKFHPSGVPYRLLEVDLACRPCDYVHCVWQGDERYQCMTRQSPEGIAHAALELLAGAGTAT